MKNKSVWVIIPAYNESSYIEGVIKKTKKYVKNILVVDDGSEDNTKEIAEKSKSIVLRHLVNLGKGAALKTGCDYAVKKRADIIIAIDADAQHNPNKIPMNSFNFLSLFSIDKKSNL